MIFKVRRSFGVLSSWSKASLAPRISRSSSTICCQFSGLQQGSPNKKHLPAQGIQEVQCLGTAMASLQDFCLSTNRDVGLMHLVQDLVLIPFQLPKTQRLPTYPNTHECPLLPRTCVDIAGSAPPKLIKFKKTFKREEFKREFLPVS